MAGEVCDRCMTARNAINNYFLRPLGSSWLLPVQTSAPPKPVASPIQSPTNPAWPSRR
jgi:hypothetical protein